MDNKSYLKLSESSIRKVPLCTYDEFIFIVNGKEFKTSRIISDLLSPKICKLHLNDPTISQYIINTKHQGDFSQILRLVNFERQDFSYDDIHFIKEILENLNNESIIYQKAPIKITTQNIFDLLSKHQKIPDFFSEQIDDEIDFLSSHFDELFEYSEQYQKLQLLNLDIIERIINNPKLRLVDEDQLLAVINYLYSIDSTFSILYEYVEFKTASANSMKEFINVFDINDINASTWKSLSKRLEKEVKERKSATNHYLKLLQKESPSNEQSNVKHPSVDPFSIFENQRSDDDPFAVRDLHENDPFNDGMQNVDDPFADGMHNENDPFADSSASSDDPFAAIMTHPNDPFSTSVM